MADFARESMLEMFIFEMNQLVEQLEQCILESEESGALSVTAVNEIFRIMHTIKGSAAMMLYNNIADASHKIEDMFFYIRENRPENIDDRVLTDIVLDGIDFVKAELGKIEAGEESDGDGTKIVNDVKAFMTVLKNGGKPAPEKQAAAVVNAAPVKEPEQAESNQAKSSNEETEGLAANENTAEIGEEAMFKEMHSDMDADVLVYDILLKFEDGCEMENVRCYTVLKNLEEITLDIDYLPRNLDSNDKGEEISEEIRTNGFKIRLISDARVDEVKEIIEQTIFLEDYEIKEVKKEVKKAARGDAGSIAENREEKKSGSGSEVNKEEKVGVHTVSIEAGEPKGEAAHYFKIMIKFEEGCEMENIRAYTVLRNMEQAAVALTHSPPDILENEETAEVIRRNGFKINLKTNAPYERVRKILEETVFLKEMTIEDANAGETKTLVQKPRDDGKKPDASGKQAEANGKQTDGKKPLGGTMISVNINKLDSLLNLTGELVTSEAMVTQNPDLAGLDLENFQKAVRQLRKIINDIQDTVMSMRMVPLSPTFAKMHRIVRDMCKQLNKDVSLELIGEDTEVDKNIIEHISDPLMHIIRNSVDHGIESPDKRRQMGKNEKGTVILEARNSGGDVLITVKDDGGGIDKEKVLEKARTNGMLKKPENEYTDKEIFNFIFMPGFSTNDEVTAYSGRGVGMDVVTTNIEQVGGSILVDSEEGEGTTTTLKIPLTLAIINGMIIEINNAKYTIPINTIKESFKGTEEEILRDPDGNEMIVVRGECYNVVRLHEFYGLDCERLKVDDGIMIMLENDEQTIVVLANELIGEQQVVVKAVPKYIKKVRGLSGCTLLGNGDISLIVDSAGFFNN